VGLDFTYESDKSKFRIPACNKQAALLAVKSLDQGKKVGYIEPGEIASARTLEEAFEIWGWYVSTDEETGDIISMDEAPEKYTDAEMLLWDAIAPYVQTGSVLQCIGPEGEHWQWVFTGGKCGTVEGVVRWLDPESDADGGLHHDDAEKMREFARDKYAIPSSDDIEIDPGAQLSVGDEGAFVQAWVWVSFEDVGLGSEEDEDE
jgi:hypothetical protein